MKTRLYPSTFNKHRESSLIAVLIVALFAFGDLAVFAQSGVDLQPTATPIQEAPDAPKISNDQLDSLVAPIALYPDPLLSQMLVASTYPLELIQLQQWLDKSGGFMNEKAVTESVQKEDWDPSIQAMAMLPAVVKQLAENIKWTSDLGNAFLAQQGDVMEAVQRMRTKAKDGGKLQSNEQLKVETKEVESKTVVVIEQASPEVVYVPSYNPTVVWGVMSYPYPYMYYPPIGYYGGAYIGFGTGIAIGAAWGGWGWGTGWGNNNININRNNNFVSHYNNTNINRGDRVNQLNSGNNTWRHNPQHRGGAPYANKSIANRYGGAARGDSMGIRQSIARQNPGQFGGGRQAGTMDRSGLGSGGRNFSNMAGNRGSFGGDRIGSREISRGSGQRNMGSFGGSGSWGGGAARASSSRGSASMGGGGFGGRGGFSGGGMRGGGMRGGGGRRR